jgi:hypothetical protein
VPVGAHVGVPGGAVGVRRGVAVAGVDGRVRVARGDRTTGSSVAVTAGVGVLGKMN